MQVSCLKVTMLLLYIFVLFAIFGWWWTFHKPEDSGELGLDEPLVSVPEDTELEAPDSSDEIRVAEVHTNPV